MLGIEALDLLDAGASVLGEVEDVDLAVGEDDPHADRGVPQAVDAALGVGDGVVLQSCLLHQQIELALEDPRCPCNPKSVNSTIMLSACPGALALCDDHTFPMAAVGPTSLFVATHLVVSNWGKTGRAANIARPGNFDPFRTFALLLPSPDPSCLLASEEHFQASSPVDGEWKLTGLVPKDLITPERRIRRCGVA